MKVPGGKMVEVRVEFGEAVTKARILGDFFMYPDTALEGIESLLVGTQPQESEAAIAKRISTLVKLEGATMIGLTPEAIANVVKRAIENAMESNKA